MKYRIYECTMCTGENSGYMAGMIWFEDTDSHHEFFFRHKDDPKNGPGNTLVSIDYGFRVPNIDDMWDDITNELIEICKD